MTSTLEEMGGLCYALATSSPG